MYVHDEGKLAEQIEMIMGMNWDRLSWINLLNTLLTHLFNFAGKFLFKEILGLWARP